MYNNIEYTLNLFENNIKQLCSLIKPEDNWEFIIVDFASTDVDVNDFLSKSLYPSNMSYKIITLNEEFNKGKGFNIAIHHVSHEIVFCLDADMIIKTYDLFNDIDKYVVNEKKALFPICWSYNDSTHTNGWKRESGKGNVIFLREYFVPYIEKTSWGQEDDANYYNFELKSKIVRTYYNDNFVHQWHPPTDWHK